MVTGPAPPGNIVRHEGSVPRSARERMLGQRGCVVWLTGLSGSGKSTIARALEERLVAEGHLAYVLDGDNIRHGLSSDLGFSPEDREENIRRIAEVAALFADAGLIAITAFISPYRRDRARVRETVGSASFIEVFVDTPVETCEQRDPKGLYRRARTGELPAFTGVSAPYEQPESADVVLDTVQDDVDGCVDRLHSALSVRGLLPAAG
jgi:adenylyl-sulfate kinase